MNYGDLKTLMKKYLGNKVNSREFENLFFDIPIFRQPHLHKCVTKINEYPEFNDYLEEYLKICDNVNEIDNFGCTALHIIFLIPYCAAIEKTVKILIFAGVNIDLQNNNGNTALHLACIYNYVYNYVPDYDPGHNNLNEIINTLILANANVFDLKNKRNKTPYDCMSWTLKNYLQIDKENKTIGIKLGKMTKAAKK